MIDLKQAFSSIEYLVNQKIEVQQVEIREMKADPEVQYNADERAMLASQEHYDSTNLVDENTHLLHKSSSLTGNRQYSEDVSISRAWLPELILIAKSSLPVVLAYTLQNSLQTVSVLIVGRLSPESLAIAAFSYMFAMSTAWLIALGGSTALDTLASSTFTGSKNPHDLGVLLQRSFLVLTGFYIPVAALWICSKWVFRFLGQEEFVCEGASRFLMVLIPGGLGYIYFEIMKKFLQAQGRSSEISCLSLLTMVRYHARRNLCSVYHITLECRTQLSPHLYI